MITIGPLTLVTITGADFALNVDPAARVITVDSSFWALQQTFNSAAPVTIDEIARLITAPEGWRLQAVAIGPSES